MITELFSLSLVSYPFSEKGLSVLVNVVAKHWETFLPFTVELKGLLKPTNMKETVPIIQVVSSVLEQ